jgi:hypothetical protein
MNFISELELVEEALARDCAAPGPGIDGATGACA